ncbi:MarR family winged helix-turn-helix transcriptional regulator [Protaetiibacter mangrovi]|uniref:MarR family winged helix-turn-helix transcriptional regulator n=1 Tax=Protaetiibacter mangrovi TaxID=2970926 RepID=A0ABT1ZGE7_9MICO|nr:MarR family winged helix-turn-helix transcriptional regulator [Protaetiibacter mangrovi]MCS0499770.1 MarR family winged helix-turn-helix transcriptional regulator [Protaetiibacter mangrovi]TPX03096.1 winged helix-turn-helix transcriptional regulator [Schumannella luteola]
MNDRADAVDAWESLYRAQVSVLRALLAEFPDDEVNFTEYDVLFNLYRQPGRALRIRDLNRHLLLTQPSVSRLLDRLVARGIVVKRRDPADARGTIVALTEHGVEVFRRVGAQHARAIAVRMSVLDPDERRTLRALTEKLRAGASPS